MAIIDPIEAVRFWLHDTEVEFTNSEIQEFLDLEKVIDADGYPPTDASWTPTYDVMRAAGRGWMYLAGSGSNKPLSYKVGDLSVTYDKEYCLKRARDLLGAASHPAQRRDEQEEPDVLARYRSE